MTTHAPFPAFRGAHVAKAVVLALILLLAIAAVPSPAPAAPGNGGSGVWLQGYVDRATGPSIQFRGRWYELAGARIVDAYGRPLAGDAIQKNAYVYIRVENGIATQLRVYQNLGR